MNFFSLHVITISLKCDVVIGRELHFAIVQVTNCSSFKK